ncbi:MAG TPA: hypothetical protein VD866_20910 [Urbifossiella sp.]|nr:hypothetical protein [Urbifossiella sp.]
MPTPTNPPPLLPPSPHPAPAAEPEYYAPPDVVARWERILDGHIEPSDYLTLPPDGLAWVEKELAFAQARLPGVPMDPGFRRDHLLRRTLDYHFGGKLVATLYRPEGVVVLAEGISAIGALLRAVRGDVRDEIRTETPHRW